MLMGTLGVLVLAYGAAADGPRLAPEQVPSFVVPHMTAPPVIDGTIDPVEWQEAVAISGVGEYPGFELLPRPTTYFLAWDLSGRSGAPFR